MERSAIFISHAHEDDSVALRLKQWIDERLLGGVTVFLSSDRQSIKAGDSWLKSIGAALRESRMMIVLCSERAMGRPWLFFEAGGACFRDTPVVPVCLPPLEPPALVAPLSFLQACNLSVPGDVGALLGQIASVSGLRCPSLDATADGAWLVTGERPGAPQLAPAIGTDAFVEVSLDSLEHLAAQVEPEVLATTQGALVAFFATFAHGELPRQLRTWARAPRWTAILGTRLAAAGGAAPDAALRSPRVMADFLARRSTERGWTEERALRDLEERLPGNIPPILAAFLAVSKTEERRTLGWRMQRVLAEAVARHPSHLLACVFGTAISLEPQRNPLHSFAESLTQLATRMLETGERRDLWFRRYWGMSYERFLEAAEQARKIGARARY